MTVFLSWSGPRSKRIAEVLKTWLPSVIQAIKPFFSPDDVAKGSRWSGNVGSQLQDCSVGLIILTRENLEAPWIHFEAGALGKSLSQSRVCPLLFDGLEPTDVQGPLEQFQSAPFNETETKRVLKMINDELKEGALEPDVFERVFGMWWPQLAADIEKAVAERGDEAAFPERRTDRDMLEEVLILSRSMSRDVRQGSVLTTNSKAVEDAAHGMAVLLSLTELMMDDEAVGAVKHLHRPVRWLAARPNGSAWRPMLNALTALLHSGEPPSDDAEVLSSDAKAGTT